MTTGVKDKAGNALASDKVWSFTTASPDTDTTAPTVTGTSPTNGKTSVGRGTNVTATFSEAIDSATLTKDTFTLVKRDDSTATRIGATVTLSSDVKQATLNPSADLSRCTWYKATVTTGVKDKAGNALDQDPNATGNQPKEWTFKTRGC